VTIGITARIGTFAARSRQAEVARRGAQAIPFDLDAATHRFQPRANGGIQQVTTDNPSDTEQIALIRAATSRTQPRFMARICRGLPNFRLALRGSPSCKWRWRTVRYFSPCPLWFVDVERRVGPLHFPSEDALRYAGHVTDDQLDGARV
jgi:hypothetical protein